MTSWILRISSVAGIGFVAVILLSVPAWGTTILLDDDFNDNSLDASKWTVNVGTFNKGPTSVNEANQQIEIQGRGHLNTTSQFSPATAPENGLRIRGQWTFNSGDDMLQILTRTDGVPAGTYGETQNGIEFGVNAIGNNTNMRIHGRGSASVTNRLNEGNLGAANGETYNFSIRDDGSRMLFSMQQVGGSKYRSVVASSSSSMPTNLISFHNRESGRRSNLDNVIIDSPSAWFPVSDDFNDGVIDIEKWYTVRSNGVTETPTQHLQISDRGYLNTVNQYDPLAAPGDGVRIRGTWSFSSGDKDVIQVLTRSDGTPDPSNCCGETKTGVQFSNWTGSAMGFGGRGGVTVTGNVVGDNGKPAIGETYDFDIRDDGTNLFYTMRQVGGSKQLSGIAASNSVTATNVITFHNREGSRTSWLDNVRIDSPVANTAGLNNILLEDRFTDNSLDTTKWNTVTAGIPQTPKSVTEQDQRIRLEGRAYLNTVAEYDPAALGGLTVRGRWTFESGGDLMQLLTRSDGTPNPGNCCGETTNGIEFLASSNSSSNNVKIHGRGSANVPGASQINANLPIMAGETYDFQLVDSGTDLSLQLTQVGGPKAAVATATSSSVMGTNLVTFHNRESGRLSHLDNVVIAGEIPQSMDLGSGGQFNVRQVQSTNIIGSLANADDLLAGTGAISEVTAMVDSINFSDGSSDGIFASSDPFPGGGGDDFALHVTGNIGISADGDYVFGLNMDDGARLLIDGEEVIVDGAIGGARNVYGHIELTEGIHALDLVYFERGGGAHLEMFYFDGSQDLALASAFASTAVVPEPSTLVLMAFGGLGLIVFTRRRKSRK